MSNGRGSGGPGRSVGAAEGDEAREAQKAGEAGGARAADEGRGADEATDARGSGEARGSGDAREATEARAAGKVGVAAAARSHDSLAGPGASAVVVVPVKAFTQAKMRLAPVLRPEQRAVLARKMAEHVLAAAAPLPVVVVCDDEEVATWARSRGARTLPEPGLGLNGAVNAAVAQLGTEGYHRLVVAHADLPLAHDLPRLADVQGIALVPDRHEEGTNVISLPAGCGFRFAYGPGSFSRHQQEAARTGLPWRVVRDPGLAWDVDFPSDMTVVTL